MGTSTSGNVGMSRSTPAYLGQDPEQLIGAVACPGLQPAVPGKGCPMSPG